MPAIGIPADEPAALDVPPGNWLRPCPQGFITAGQPMVTVWEHPQLVAGSADAAYLDYQPPGPAYVTGASAASADTADWARPPRVPLSLARSLSRSERRRRHNTLVNTSDPTDDELWAARLAKRRRTIEGLKRGERYLSAQLAVDRGDWLMLPAEPRTDLRTPKRTWERQMQRWRDGLLLRAPLIGSAQTRAASV